MFISFACSFSLWSTRWCQPSPGLRSSVFISTRKKKVSLVPPVEGGGLSFPEDSEKVSDWVTHPSLNQSPVGYWDTVVSLGHSGPLLGMDSIISNTRTDSLTGSQRSRKWCWEAANQCLLLSSFLSLLLFLTFFPSLLHGKFCAQSRGYKHEKIFPALGAR